MSNSKKERNQTPHFCQTIGFSIAYWFIFYSFFIFERGRNSKRSRSRELGGERILRKLPTVSSAPTARLKFTKYENMTCAETKTQMLH